MSTTADLVTALKRELKAAHYDPTAQLATELGLAESSVKRMLAWATCRCRALMPSAAPSSSTLPTWPVAWPMPNPCWPNFRKNKSAVVADKNCCWWPSAC